MKICYVPKHFSRGHLNTIRRANELLASYAEMGITITLRSLYYRFVANGWIPNKQKSYKRLGGIIGDARLAGLIDWNHLEDRTRNLASLQHFSGPEDALQKLASWYHLDMWANQQWRPEVWIEKDALVGVIERVCQENDVPFFSCRGYTSLSEMWRASMRLRRHLEAGQRPYIIHFGDHDPSGIDMTRDIQDRLAKTFMADHAFERVALNMDQVEEYNPPPNPAKITDSRYRTYVANFGDESWELDALDPPLFAQIIQEQLDGIRDDAIWKKTVKDKAKAKDRLVEIAADWESFADNKKKLSSALEEITELKGRVESLQKKAKLNGRKKKGQK